MIRKTAVFNAGEDMTPEVAAELARRAEHFHARLLMECGGKRVLLDSLIGILSVSCPRGTELTVIAEGEDELPAAETVAAMLEGRMG